MTTLVSVSEDSTADDVLAERYRAAYNKKETTREQWIEAKLEFAVVMLDVRDKYPAHQDYSRWIRRYNLPDVNDGTRKAFVNIGRLYRKDPSAARAMFEQTSNDSVHYIWRTRPSHLRSERSSRTSTSTPPPPRPNRVKGRPGRKPRLPDVMQEDNEGLVIKRAPAAPVPERPVAILKGLKPHEVDPDFKGTSLEFITAYGHVNLHTKEQIEEHKRREDESAALGAIADWIRTGEVMEAALAKVDLTIWLSRPAKAEKWEAWCRKGERAYNKLRVLKG